MTYPFLEKPSSNFARVRDGRESMPLYVDVDLSVAQSIAGGNPFILPIAGNSFYIDADTANVGNAVVHFQDVSFGTTSAPFFVSPGFIANVPFTQLLIENAAQPGKRLRIFYGVDIDFQAGVNASIAISGTVNVGNPKSIYAPTYNLAWSKATAFVANTAYQVLAPGANVNGAILVAGSVSIFGAGGIFCTLVAGIAPPASISDGDILLVGDYTGGYPNITNHLTSPIAIDPGDGIWAISNVATTQQLVRALIDVK